MLQLAGIDELFDLVHGHFVLLGLSTVIKVSFLPTTQSLFLIGIRIYLHEHVVVGSVPYLMMRFSLLLLVGRDLCSFNKAEADCVTMLTSSAN